MPQATLDQSNMRRDILAMPQQLLTGYANTQNLTMPRIAPSASVIIYGLGGSALPGRLLELFWKHTGLKTPIYTHNDYDLPHYGNDKKALHVFISYSGNTEETLSAYKAAKKEGLLHNACVIASGGKLYEYAKKDKVPFVQMPLGIQPRMALGYQFSALLGVLEKSGLITNQKYAIAKIARELKPEKQEKLGVNLAQKLKNKVPIFYAPQELAALAYTLKIQMNENGKTHSFLNAMPEMHHNELMSARHAANVQPIFIMPRHGARWLKRRKIITDIYPNAHVIDINYKKLYNEVFNTLILGNWTSYYSALLKNIDPTPVHLVEQLKKKLAN